MDLEAQKTRSSLECRTIYEGCATKLALLEGYIMEMLEMAPRGMQENGADSTVARIKQTNECEEEVQRIKTRCNIIEANLEALGNTKRFLEKL